MYYSKLLISIFILTFLIIHSLIISADTIIDSVYSDPVLDGYIMFSQNAQTLSVNNWMYDFYAGDIGTNVFDPDPNSYFRSFISFDLPDIPEDYYVDSVFVRFYQYESGGYDTATGEYTDFPVWDVAGGDTIKCIMSHIDYGNSLDVGDWEKGDIGNQYTYQNNTGTVTESGEDGYRYLDVTSSVIQDYELGRDKTQFRIAFQMDTDWDGEGDLVAFISGNPPIDEYTPIICFVFSNELNSLNDEFMIANSLEIKISPNPVSLSQFKETKIKYELSQNANVILEVFNIKGQIIETLVNSYHNKGKHSILWNVENQSSGIYLYKISSGNKTLTGKCLLIK